MPMDVCIYLLRVSMYYNNYDYRLFSYLLLFFYFHTEIKRILFYITLKSSTFYENNFSILESQIFHLLLNCKKLKKITFYCSYSLNRKNYNIIPQLMKAVRSNILPNISQTGKKISNYIYYYGDLIGKGNFARVYRATHLHTKQLLAVKTISLDQLKSKRLESLVFEEIKILQLMNHPNILKFYEALMSDRNCYIVTQLCTDGNLEERIKRSPLSYQEIAGITLQLLEGLGYLRQMNVVHRDFKSANIFLSKGKAKIADFGLAKLYKQRFHDLDIGSPHYMSPEGIILNIYSDKTDIWALGIVIYQMIHGKTPFGHINSDPQLKYWIARPLGEEMFKKDISPFFKRLILYLLQVDEIRRPTIYDLFNSSYIEGLQEIARKGTNEVVQFLKNTFHDTIRNGESFHKKTEINLLSANRIGPSNLEQVSRSMEAKFKTNIMKPNISFTIKPNNNTLDPNLPQVIRINGGENIKSFFRNPRQTLPAKTTQSSNRWQGQSSTKTIETRQSQGYNYTGNFVLNQHQ